LNLFGKKCFRQELVEKVFEVNQIHLSANLLNSKTWKTFDDNDQCHFSIKGQSSNVDRGKYKRSKLVINYNNKKP